MTPAQVISLLSRLRLPLSDEKKLQAALAEEFDRAGIVHEREARLSVGDVTDFLIGRMVVEVKIKGAKRAIYRQLERYALHDAVQELVLVTNVPMGMPEEINGKPVYVLNLAKAWL